MNVNYFGPRKYGPEVKIEDAIAEQIPDIFPCDERFLWTAGSIPLGSGMPDLTIVTYEPQVFASANFEMPDIHILAYLRVVGRARLDTITERIGARREKIVRCLKSLVDAKAVLANSSTYSLSPEWREILPEIVAVEVKVKNWREAVNQAANNLIFAHKSFVALPRRVAQNLRQEPIFNQLGIGLISVDEDYKAGIIRRARRRQPRVWTYYYQLASHIANRPKEA